MKNKQLNMQNLATVKYEMLEIVKKILHLDKKSSEMTRYSDAVFWRYYLFGC